MEQKKYGIIYADPPWTYRVYSSKGSGRSAASHYPVMDLQDARLVTAGDFDKAYISLSPVVFIFI